uniref:SOCS box domain-containing protein n=1 Tax=Trichogramma kaykai TaxID=54128 RepID=A0ABD2XNB2_9HYME
MKSLRENVNWEIEKERDEFLRQLDPLVEDWVDELPTLRDIFRRDEIDRLLTDSSKDDFLEFVDFVVRSGYKDEPDVDENGKPLLRRTTAIHHVARLRPTHWFVSIPHLFKIYDRFDANYIDEDGSTHFHAACMLPDCREVVAKFLELGQDPNCLAQIASFEPPLLVALSFRNLSTVEALLRSGADPNLASKDGFSALHVIFRNNCRGDEEMMAFFGILEDTQRTQLRAAVDAKDKWGWTPLQLAVTSLLPRVVDELLARGASLSSTSFVFPTSEVHFDPCFDAWAEDKDHKLRLASAALTIVDSLEKAGYELDRGEALTIMKLFAKHGMFEESAFADGRWYSDERFARAAKKMTMKKKKKGLSLHDLIPLRPKEAARLFTVGDYYEFVGAVSFRKLPRGSHDACAVHLCEKLSRGFFRRWALDSFRELIRYRLPPECCDIILELLTNKDLYRVCSAAAGQRP